MYSHEWDGSTGGYVLTPKPSTFSKEPRPVYYKELDILGFDKYWNYDKNDSFPYMWAEANNYYYRGRQVAKIKGGTLYTAPEITLLDDPEPDGFPLRFVDIPAMVEKNRPIMEQLTQETIKKIYNTYVEYQKRVDAFYVAFSGGKDSVVALDLVQRALPHNAFKVLFGNTDMEFPTTLDLIEEIRGLCAAQEIDFYDVKAAMPAEKSWDIFGPPARKVRWCCTVHKTAPVINKLNELYDRKYIRTMMITGVRADESTSRSEYDELSKGKKMAGQYSYHPILEWSSAEIYLYIYMNSLPINEAYKLGFNRVGCIMCPNSSEKHEFMKRMFFEDEVLKFTSKIITNSAKDLSGENAKRFMEVGGWKTRLSGRELKYSEDERFTYEEKKGYLEFSVIDLDPAWKEWYKTIGDLQEINESEFLLEYSGVVRRCHIEHTHGLDIMKIENEYKTKNAIEFISFFRSILAKSQYCIRCGTCEAECPYRNINMDNGRVTISEHCIRCHECLTIPYGCLLYNSIKGSKVMKKLTGINKYLSVGIDANWIENYAHDHAFEPGNRKTDVMFGFMSDAGIVRKKQITPIGEVVFGYDMDTELPWAIMLCNLAYTSQYGWYIKNIPFFERVSAESVALRLQQENVTDKAIGEFWNGFKVILDTTKPLNSIGFGTPEIEGKVTKTGDVKKRLLSIYRAPWRTPDERVILYSLYKFAEKCGNYRQFTLTRLLDTSIESDAVSPTQIFGLDREIMEKILNGLTFNYPDLIEARFTLGLDNITLKSDMSADDILIKLF